MIVPALINCYNASLACFKGAHLEHICAVVVSSEMMSSLSCTPGNPFEQKRIVNKNLFADNKK